MRENTLQLHINRDELNIEEFKRSFNAFMDLIQALSDDNAPMAQWLISVNKGSMVMNAALTSEDPKIDIHPMFQVIKGNVASLISGINAESCSQTARSSYAKLSAAINSLGEMMGEPIAEINAFGSDGSCATMPVTTPHTSTQNQKGYSAIGALSGFIYLLDSKRGKNTIGIIDDVTGTYIKGTFHDSCTQDAREAFKRRAVVSGTINYRADGSISSMKVRNVRQQPQHVPKLSELFGIVEG